MRVIQGKKGRDKYYFDEKAMTVSDKDGNVIRIRESLDGVSDSNLQFKFDFLFHQLYLLINETDATLRAFKKYSNVVNDEEYKWGSL